ncbi:hypothetical protein MRX96_057171 [Rhipicephalus microplus]
MPPSASRAAQPFCQIWWSNRAVETAVMSFPTVNSLVEGLAPLPTIGLNSAQIVSDGAVVLEASPQSDPENRHLVPFLRLAADFHSCNLASCSEEIVWGVPFAQFS